MVLFASLAILWLLTPLSANAGNFVRPTVSSSALSSLSDQLVGLNANVSRIDKVLNERTGAHTDLSNQIQGNQDEILRIQKLVDNLRRQDQSEGRANTKQLESMTNRVSQLESKISQMKEKNNVLGTPPCKNHRITPNMMHYFYIENVSTKLVLGVQNNDRAAGTKVVTMTKTAHASQMWTNVNNVFYNKLNGMVLTLSGVLKVYPCHGGSSQLWYFEGENIRNGNGKYIDIISENSYPGAELFTFEKKPTLRHWFTWNQKFRGITACNAC